MAARKTKIISENEYYYYTASDLPFPASDRDLVIHSLQWTDPLTGTIHSQSKVAPNMMPKQKGFVRITQLETRWKMIPKSDGTIDIDYYGMANPGGNIPIWMVNMGISIGPLKSLQNMTEISEKLQKERNAENLELRTSKE